MRDNISAGSHLVICPHALSDWAQPSPSVLQRMRGPKDGTVASSGQASYRPRPWLLAGHEQTTDTVPAHAERHWTNWFVIPGALIYEIKSP
jgi:hypothetical protein